MDTLALGVIAVGIVAAIGVVLVAMSDGGKQPAEAKAQPDAQPEPATPQPRKASPRPRTPRRPRAAPVYLPVPQHNGYTTSAAAGQDPLVAGFMQVVSDELQNLRQQQDKIDQRLKMINGIAELMHDMQGSSVGTNGNNHHVSARSNRSASQG
jgi:hypothetical protein